MNIFNQNKQKYEQKRSALTQEIDSLFNEYIDPIHLIVNDNNLDSTFNRLRNCKIPPELMNIGVMYLENDLSTKKDIPCLISYMRSSATLFVSGIDKHFDIDMLNIV